MDEKMENVARKVCEDLKWCKFDMQNFGELLDDNIDAKYYGKEVCLTLHRDGDTIMYHYEVRDDNAFKSGEIDECAQACADKAQRLFLEAKARREACESGAISKAAKEVREYVKAHLSEWVEENYTYNEGRLDGYIDEWHTAADGTEWHFFFDGIDDYSLYVDEEEVYAADLAWAAKDLVSELFYTEELRAGDYDPRWEYEDDRIL